MSTEICQICKEECTPWIHVNGHICLDCGSDDKWISVKEELPKNLSAVLVWVTGLYYEPKIAYFGGKDFYESICSDNNISRWVTHWMYLPSSPRGFDAPI